MDFHRNGKITWDDFINYTLSESAEKAEFGFEQMLEKPISSLPRVVKGLHRHPILKIEFNPVVTKVIIYII